MSLYYIEKIIDKARQLFARKDVRIFCIVFVVHLIFALFLYLSKWTPFGNVKDNLSYHSWALQIADLIRSGEYIWGAVYPHHWFPLWVGFLYTIFGSFHFVGVLANVILSSLSAVLFFKTAVLINHTLSDRYAFWSTLGVFILYPSFIFHSSILLKETWIVFLVLLIVYMAVRMFSRLSFRWKEFVIILIAFVLLRDIRYFVGLAAISGVLISWFFVSRIFLKKRILYGIGMIGAVIIVGYMFSGNVLKTGGIFNQTTIFEYKTLKHSESIQSSSMNKGHTATNISIVEKNDSGYKINFKQLTFSVLTVSLGPFPGQVPFSRYLLSIPDLLWWYTVLMLSIIGFLYTRRSVIVILPILIAVIIIAGVAFGFANIGAIMRYRAPAFIMLALFMPSGIPIAKKYCLGVFAQIRKINITTK